MTKSVPDSQNPSAHAYAVILAGGSGSRLWPVSRRNKPKQFQSLLGDYSFLQMAYNRIRSIFPKRRIFVQSTIEYKDLILEQLPDLPEGNVLIEPEARDTGPAYVLALAALLNRDPDAVASFFYADNIIRDESGSSLEHAVRRAIAATNEFPAFLVTIGVTPKFPHTGLGYIQLGKEVVSGSEVSSLFRVDSFIEKPDAELAKQISASGEHLWNTGYKTGRADTILDMMMQSCPVYRREAGNILDAKQAGDHLAMEQSFHRLPRISFEYLVSGRIGSMLAMATDLEWSDAGDWDIIHRLLSNDNADRFYKSGRVVGHECRNSLVISQTKPVVAMNLSDVIVIETDDAVLVMGTDSSQKIRQVLEELAITDPGVL